jgi:hypothetical protein
MGKDQEQFIKQWAEMEEFLHELKPDLISPFSQCEFIINPIIVKTPHFNTLLTQSFDVKFDNSHAYAVYR